MAKSYKVALILWATLGLVGGHHFYLGRDRHGVIHLLTFGGFFLGWLWDFVKLRSYVRWANFDDELDRDQRKKIEANEQPSEPLLANLATTVLCQLGSALALMAVPAFLTADENFSYYGLPFVTALSVAFVLYFIGNIGETEGSFLSALKGALLSVPFYLYSPEGSSFWCVIAAKNTFVRRYRRRPETRPSVGKRVLKSALIVTVVLGLASSYFFFNCQVETDDGSSVSCVTSMHNFFNSPAWADLKSTVRDLYNFIRYNGWKSLWKEIVTTFDMTGTDNAAKVLGVSKFASEQEIKAAYKTLARQFHPDKVRDPGEQQAAQEKFMEIQQAYTLLSKTKLQRDNHNKKFRPTEDRTEL